MYYEKFCLDYIVSLTFYLTCFYMIITTCSYPRAALIGNPSDGYYGKTIAFLFNNFKANVTLYESPDIEIVPSTYDSLVFKSMQKLTEDVKLYGYYGGIRLVKGAIKIFYEYCIQNGLSLPRRNFTIRYTSDIPYGLGLAGSSAIITACMKAMMAFFGVRISKPQLANIVWSVENVELKISAGLQDRVAQAYECPVYMDFSKELMEKQGFGNYEIMDPALLPDMYIAYRTDLAEGSEVVHNNFRERYHYGDPEVIDAICQWTELTVEVKKLILESKKDQIAPLLNKNFDIRRKVMNLSSKNIEMVELARSVGASAKFTGSGGAIIGTYNGEDMFEELSRVLSLHHIQVLKPGIVFNED